MGFHVSTLVGAAKNGVFYTDPLFVQRLLSESGCNPAIGSSRVACRWYGIVVGAFDPLSGSLIFLMALSLLILGVAFLILYTVLETRKIVRIALAGIVVATILVSIGLVVIGYLYRAPPTLAR